MNFSNFVSNFGGATNIDILTAVSNSTKLTYSDPSGGSYYGSYVCLGNLLIQYTNLSDPSNDIPNYIKLSKAGFYQMYYPIPYDSQPYIVMPFSMRLGYEYGDPSDNNWGAVTTLTYIDSSYCSFNIRNYASTTGILAIGPRPQSLCMPIPFTTDGSVNQVTQGGNYYIITFNSSGTVSFNYNVNNVSIICVGGGGGGGAGYSNSISSVGYPGKGGGGGGNYQLIGQNVAIGTYTNIVGSGGIGGTDWNTSYQGGNGGTSSVTTPTNAVILSCGGGFGGGSGGQTNTQPGKSGTVLTPIDASGNGGAGGANGNPGYDSYSYDNSFNIPSEIASYVYASYGGGGGGSNDGKYGGGSGNNGKGGSYASNSSGNSPYNGQNATTIGSGGGGAGNTYPLASGSPLGGNGANGVIIYYFSYP